MDQNRIDRRALLIKAVTRFALGIILLGLFLFLIAGDIGYPNAWLYLAALSAALLLFGILLRIKNEEELLKKGLPGYADYTKKVRHRLIPFIW